MNTSTKITVTDPIAQQHSDRLLSVIKQKINDAGGKISFADYMQLCLYTPGLGYYSAGSYKLGKKGDFTTAPEISPLFSQCLAQHIKDVFGQLNNPDILEFGAGSGKMAIDIMLKLEADHCLPEHYYIIEASADLRQRQEQSISSSLPHLKHKVIWLDALPQNFVGVILANEVCDAMPVHCLRFANGHVQERYIRNTASGLAWCEDELSSPELRSHIEQLMPLIADNELDSEVNLAAQSWLRSLSDSLKQGSIFIIDYGYPQISYYHPQRANGTLMCYYQHQGHDDPLILPGLQDITAHVDFTALAQTAFDHDLDVAGFQSQADFLLAAGLTELIKPGSTDDFDHLQQTAEIKRLTLPSQMGETFKVLTLCRDLDDLLPRIQLGDRRYNL